MVLNDISVQLDLIDIYRTFYPKTAECTFFSRAHGTFSRIDDIPGHKTSRNKFKRIEVFFLTTTVLNQKSITGRKMGKAQNMETKQQATKKPVGQCRNQK